MATWNHAKLGIPKVSSKKQEPLSQCRERGRPTQSMQEAPTNTLQEDKWCDQTGSHSGFLTVLSSGKLSAGETQCSVNNWFLLFQGWALGVRLTSFKTRLRTHWSTCAAIQYSSPPTHCSHPHPTPSPSVFGPSLPAEAQFWIYIKNSCCCCSPKSPHNKSFHTLYSTVSHCVSENRLTLFHQLETTEKVELLLMASWSADMSVTTYRHPCLSKSSPSGSLFC